MEVSSYGGTSTESSGLVRILKDLSASIADEDVLIVEDIIDTGLTLNYLIRYLRGKDPATLRICTLLDKPARRLVEIPVDYVGFTIPDQFVVGYGLDYGELYRNLRYRRRPEAGGLLGTHGLMTMHRRPLGRGPDAGRGLGAAHRRRLRPAVVAGRWRRPASRSRAATASRASASSSSWSASRRWRCVALPYAAGDRPVGSRSLAVVRDCWRSPAGSPSRGVSSSWRCSGRSSSASRSRSSPTDRGSGWWDRPGHPGPGGLDDGTGARVPLTPPGRDRGRGRSRATAGPGSSRRRPARSPR